MEEKKRKGYKTQEQQNEANKRYRATEEGKEKTKHSSYKSRAKVFINKMATLEELEELENLIKNKKNKRWVFKAHLFHFLQLHQESF